MSSFFLNQLYMQEPHGGARNMDPVVERILLSGGDLGEVEKRYIAAQGAEAFVQEWKDRLSQLLVSESLYRSWKAYLFTVNVPTLLDHIAWTLVGSFHEDKPLQIKNGMEFVAAACAALGLVASIVHPEVGNILTGTGLAGVIGLRGMRALRIRRRNRWNVIQKIEASAAEAAAAKENEPMKTSALYEKILSEAARYLFDVQNEVLRNRARSVLQVVHQLAAEEKRVTLHRLRGLPLFVIQNVESVLAFQVLAGYMGYLAEGAVKRGRFHPTGNQAISSSVLWTVCVRYSGEQLVLTEEARRLLHYFGEYAFLCLKQKDPRIASVSSRAEALIVELLGAVTYRGYVLAYAEDMIAKPVAKQG